MLMNNHLRFLRENQQIPEEEQQALISQLLSTSRGGLEAIGHLLDTPGAYLRGALAGKVGERLSGRDMLTEWGVTEANDPSRWEWGDFAGIAADIIADPLTFANPFGAATKAGQIAKAAGITGREMSEIAAKQLGAKAGAIGPRQAATRLTLGDVHKVGGDIQSNLDKVLAARGINLADVAKQNLRGGVGLDLPLSGFFTKSGQNIGGAIGSTPYAAALAKGLDAAGNFLLNGNPIGRKLGELFDPAARGLLLQGAQEAMRKTDELQIKGEQAIKNWGQELKTTLAKDMELDGGSDSIRYLMEFGDQTHVLNDPRSALKRHGLADISDETIAQIPAIKKGINDAKEYYESVGGEIPEWLSKVGADYAPRKATDPVIGHKTAKPVTEPFNFGVDQKKHRLEEYDVEGGTHTINKFTKDKWVSGETALLEDPVERANYILDNNTHVSEAIELAQRDLGGKGPMAKNYFGTRGDPKLKTVDNLILPSDALKAARAEAAAAAVNNVDVDDLTKAVLDIGERNDKFAAHLKTVNPLHSFDEGVGRFADHIVDDVVKYKVDLMRAASSIKGIQNMLAFSAVPHHGPGMIPLKEAFDTIGLGKHAEKIDQITGVATREKDYAQAEAYFRTQLEALGKDKDMQTIYVPDKYIAEATKIASGATDIKYLKMLDGSLQFYKNMLLMNPSYHTRNLSSGIMQNLLTGATLLSSPRKLWETMSDSYRLSAGKDAVYLHKIPMVSNALKELGLTVDAKNANDWIRSQMYSTGVLGELGDVTGSAADILRRKPTGDVLPGQNPQRGDRLVRHGTGEEYVSLHPEESPVHGAFPGGVHPGGAMGPTYKESAIRGNQRSNYYHATFGVRQKDIKSADLFPGVTPEGRAKLVDPLAANQPLGKSAYEAGSNMWRGVTDILGSKSIGEAVDTFRKGAINPLNMEKVKDGPSKFGLATLHENAARNVEGINRASAFIGWLQQGVTPMEAATRVKAAHADYSRLTQFEKTIMKRVIPFYSYNRRMAEFVANDLVHRPGGGISQTIQATNTGRTEDSWVPDYVGEGMAMPNPFSKDSYITGLGLMHEGPLNQFALSGDTGSSIERTGQKLLANANPLIKLAIEGSTGRSLYTGRPLSELYPFPITGATSKGAQLANAALANSPAAKGITVARKMLDDRRGWGETAVNLLTGFQTTHLSGGIERAKELEARKALEKALRSNPKMRTFENVYVPADQKAKLTEAELKLLGLYKVMQQRAKAAAKANKEKGAGAL